MSRGNHGGSIAGVMRRRGLRIALALLLVALMPFAMKQYVVQEYLLASIAIVLVSVLVLLFSGRLRPAAGRSSPRTALAEHQPGAPHCLEPASSPRKPLTS